MIELESALERKWREKMEDERNAMMRELAIKDEELMEESKKEKEEIKRIMEELEREKMKHSKQVGVGSFLIIQLINLRMV